MREREREGGGGGGGGGGAWGRSRHIQLLQTDEPPSQKKRETSYIAVVVLDVGASAYYMLSGIRICANMM